MLCHGVRLPAAITSFCYRVISVTVPFSDLTPTYEEASGLNTVPVSEMQLCYLHALPGSYE